MITRYDQDLSPFFARIQAGRRARRDERRKWMRDGWSSLLAHVGVAGRRG